VAEAGLHPGEVVGGRDVEAPGEGAVGALEAVVGHALLLLKGLSAFTERTPSSATTSTFSGSTPGR